MNPLLSGPSSLIDGISFAPGTRTDLATLLRHHYRPGVPATTPLIRIARWHVPRTSEMQVIGAACFSWPVPMVRARNRHFGVRGYGAALRFANANVRTVSRVIVHPRFRGLGIARELILQLIEACPTRYLECSSAMGAFAGFLERCGFEQMGAAAGDPAYFLLDQHAVRAALSGGARSIVPTRKGNEP